MPNYILEHKGVKGMKWLKGRKPQLPPIKRPPEERLKNIPEHVMKKLSPEVKKRIREILGKKDVIEHHGVKGMRWGVIRRKFVKGVHRATRQSIKLALKGAKKTGAGISKGSGKISSALRAKLKAKLSAYQAKRKLARYELDYYKKIARGEITNVPDDINLHPRGLHGKKLKKYQVNVVKALTDKQVVAKKNAEDLRAQLLATLDAKPNKKKSKIIRPIIDEIIPGAIKGIAKKYVGDISDFAYAKHINPYIDKMYADNGLQRSKKQKKKNKDND